MLSWYDKVKRFVYRTIHSGSDVTSTPLTMPFDVAMMILIFASVVIVFAVTLKLPPDIMDVLRTSENAIVAIFTVEYALRLWTADLQFQEKGRFASRVSYVLSAEAIVDLFAILPSFLPYLLPEGMLGIRALRLIRLMRICKAPQHSATLGAITAVIKDKARDLIAVSFFMSLMVLFLSLLMYAAEHDAQPDKFEDATSALWWAVETFTKSGARGFYPITLPGRIIGSVISVLGICLIAIPTGIISSGLMEHIRNRNMDNCPERQVEGEDADGSKKKGAD